MLGRTRCGLLVLERCNHSDGEPYEWRVFAIPYGTYVLRGLGCAEEGWEYVIGGTLVVYSFLDCNGDYEFELPEGSLELVGTWVECPAAQYHY